MTQESILVIGSGHLAYRIQKLAEAGGYDVVHLSNEAFAREHAEEDTFNVIARAFKGLNLPSFKMVYVVDDQDEFNLELLITLISLSSDLPITAALFNENIAPHVRAAHPNTRILNPAKIAAPKFIEALDVEVHHTLRYTPVGIAAYANKYNKDNLILLLATTFVGLIAAATVYFHLFDNLSWLNALYFVVVTVGTVGYGDINLVQASAASKLIDIGLIIMSTFLIWIIFSLTIDRLIKKRAQLLLGRKKYSYTGHIILCGLGRLGLFVAEGLIACGEQVVVIETNEDSPNIEYLRSLGADVYIGNARLPRVLSDVGVMRAKAVYSVINNDFTNIEIGLNARSFAPTLRLVLRIFDESMSQKIKEHLDIHLTYSMTAIADEKFLEVLMSA